MPATISIAEAQKHGRGSKKVLYVIKCLRRNVWYVGKAGKISFNARMIQHVTPGSFAGCAFDRLLQMNLPEAWKWRVAVYEIDEVNKLFKQHGLKTRRSITAAENAFIKLFRPSCNISANPNPRPIPRRYKKQWEKITGKS